MGIMHIGWAIAGAVLLLFFCNSDYRRNAFSTHETDGNQNLEENSREGIDLARALD